MNNDSYKIIISVSHHCISFEYWQRDGEKKLVPMPNVSCPAPLAFYCSDTGIEIGETGIRAAHAGTPNAFDNYFERLTSDETYSFGGQRKPLRYLLLDAAEIVFSDFFKNVLLGSKGSLSDNRATMPITLVCEADVKPNERVLLLNLFRDSGYNRFMVAEYNTYVDIYFRSSLSVEYGIDRMLVAWTEGSDLTFTLFDLNDKSEKRQGTYPDLGRDPRLEYVKKLIWDRVKGQNPWLSYDFEEESIEKAATDFLNSSAPLVTTTIAMSDGMSYHYSLNRTVVDNLQCPEGFMIRTKLDEFLRECGFLDRKGIMLLLRGVAAGNVYFEHNLSSGFLRTIKTDRRLRGNTMQLILSEANEFTSSPPPPSEPGGDDGNRPTPPPKIDPKVLMLLTREMRTARANINAKFKRGDKLGAATVYKDFISEWGKDIPEQIMSEMHKWLAEKDILIESLLLEDTLSKRIKPTRPIPHSNNSKLGKKQNDGEERLSPEGTPTLKKDIYEGEQLLKSGNFNEAKRIFAGIGDEYRKQLCIDLLRDSRDLKAMAHQNLSALSPATRKNSMDKLNRILTTYRKAQLDTQLIEELIKKLK